MTALELAKRLGVSILNNKVRQPGTGVVLARIEGDELVLTPEGEEVAANLPAKAARVSRAPAVESAQAASDASDTSAPTEASPPDAAPAE